MNLRKWLLPALVALLLLQSGFLAWQVIRSESALVHGEEFLLRIGGYDPRDLLRGRYLQFSLTDINPSIIPSWWNEEELPGMAFWARLEPSGKGYHVVGDVFMERTEGPGWIPLRCDNDGLLVPPVSRFYLSEKDAARAESLLFSGAEVRIRIRVKGDRIVVRELLIDGKPLKAALEDER